MKKHRTHKPAQLLRTLWSLIKKTITAFIDDGILSRGAAVAFYTGTSLAPLLLIVIAITGLVFGEDAARGAIAEEFRSLLGKEGAEVFQMIAQSAAGKQAGGLAAALGFVMLLVTASGVFGEIQTGLNAIWRAKPRGTTLSRLLRARAASLGLVAVLGFLMLVSLVASAGLSALSSTIDYYLPFGTLILGVINTLVSFGLLSLLFGAIYKILPDITLQWREVWVGAMVTSLLFIAGKSLIGLYIGSSAIASSYGAASAPIIILLWIYYSSQVFFLGAEFTRVYVEDRAVKLNS